MPDPLFPRDPTELGTYTLSGRLGSGGFGVVYSGVDHEGAPVAIKLLNAELAADPAFRARLAREGEAMASVDSDRVARVIEVVTEGDDAYLVMELVDGASLEGHVDAYGPLRGPELWFASTGLVDALTAIHRAGIVHRDFKPANVMYGAGGVKVLDFGISTVVADNPHTRTGTFMASAAWISPEQIRDERATVASDVFMLGLVLSFMATGVHPFGTGRADAVMFRIAHHEPDLAGVTEPLRTVIAACLAKDPAQRPTVDALTVFFRSGGSDSLRVGNDSGPHGTVVVGPIVSGDTSNAPESADETPAVGDGDLEVSNPSESEKSDDEPVETDAQSADVVGKSTDEQSDDGELSEIEVDVAGSDVGAVTDVNEGSEEPAAVFVAPGHTFVVGAPAPENPLSEPSVAAPTAPKSRVLVAAVLSIVGVLIAGGVMFAALGGDKPAPATAEATNTDPNTTAGIEQALGAGDESPTSMSGRNATTNPTVLGRTSPTTDAVLIGAADQDDPPTTTDASSTTPTTQPTTGTTTPLTGTGTQATTPSPTTRPTTTQATAPKATTPSQGPSTTQSPTATPTPAPAPTTTTTSTTTSTTTTTLPRVIAGDSAGPVASGVSMPSSVVAGGSFSFSASFSDGSGIDSVSMFTPYVQGSNPQISARCQTGSTTSWNHQNEGLSSPPGSTSITFTCVLNANMASGSYTVDVYASDSLGNGTYTTRTITITSP